jgi:hypothetical protein
MEVANGDGGALKGMTGRVMTGSRLRELAGRSSREMIMPGLKRGNVALLIGPGGVGKSMFVLQVAIGFGTAEASAEMRRQPLDLLGAGPYSGGRVLLVAGEEDADDLGERIEAVCSRIFGIGGKGVQEPSCQDEDMRAGFHALIDKNIAFTPLHGLRYPLGGVPGEPMASDLVDFIRGEGFSLVILDPMVKFHNLRENDNGDMARLIAEFEFIARESRSAIILCHHVGKIAAISSDESSRNAGATRGASAITDDLRKVDSLFLMSKKVYGNSSIIRNGEVIMPMPERWRLVQHAVVKCNNAPLPKPKWYFRGEGGVLEPVRVIPKAAAGTGEGRKAVARKTVKRPGD